MTTLVPSRAAAIRRAWPFALWVLAIAVFDLRHHEFWRDEVGAMLEARAVPWSSLLGAMRLEGIPPLFHGLLKLAGAVLPDPFALVAVGALSSAVLLFGTHRLLVAIAGPRRAAAAVTFAFSLTYAYAYELGVVIRQYTLGLGLALLSLAYLRDALRGGEGRSVRAGALAAGLAALTAVHAACVAGGALLSFGLLSVLGRRPLRTWWPILLTLPAFALVVDMAWPDPERVAVANAVQHFSPRTTLHLSLQALVEGLMPADWWFSASFSPARFATALAALRSLALWGLLASAVVALGTRVVALRGSWRVEAFEVLAVVASWPPLLEITVQHYWGFYRHHLFLGIPMVVVAAGWGLDRRLSGSIAAELRRVGLACLVPWFALEVMIAVQCLALDLRYPFSDTKEAAPLLAREAHVVADAEWRSSGLLFWRPDIQMRSASWGGRPFRYIRPDADWHRTVPVPPLVAEECRQAPERVYFAGLLASIESLAACATRLDYPRTPFETQPFTWESFDLYAMNCACVASAIPGN